MGEVHIDLTRVDLEHLPQVLSLARLRHQVDQGGVTVVALDDVVVDAVGGGSNQVGSLNIKTLFHSNLQFVFAHLKTTLTLF